MVHHRLFHFSQMFFFSMHMGVHFIHRQKRRKGICRCSVFIAQTLILIASHTVKDNLIHRLPRRDVIVRPAYPDNPGKHCLQLFRIVLIVCGVYPLSVIDIFLRPAHIVIRVGIIAVRLCCTAFIQYIILYLDREPGADGVLRQPRRVIYAAQLCKLEALQITVSHLFQKAGRLLYLLRVLRIILYALDGHFARLAVINALCFRCKRKTYRQIRPKPCKQRSCVYSGCILAAPVQHHVAYRIPPVADIRIAVSACRPIIRLVPVIVYGPSSGAGYILPAIVNPVLGISMFNPAGRIQPAGHKLPLEILAELIRQLGDNAQRHRLALFNLCRIAFRPQVEYHLLNICQRSVIRRSFIPGIICPFCQLRSSRPRKICGNLIRRNIRGIADNLPLHNPLSCGRVKPQVCFFLGNRRAGVRLYRDFIFHIIPRHQMILVDFCTRRCCRTVV